MHVGAIVCVFKCDFCPLCIQDEESIANADRRGAVDAAALHGKHGGLDGCRFHLAPHVLSGGKLILHLIFAFQILITHKNQASMLMAPQAKSSGFFTSK